MNSLKKKSLISGLWVLTSFGGGQFIRLVSNLILTRLLAPELFGLMAVVSSVIIGAQLLSDIGIRDCIINNNNSHKKHYIRTAWTLSAIRGALIYLAICLLAFPLERYLGYDNLGILLIVCGSSTMFYGTASLNIDLASKNLDFKPVVINELASAIIGAVVMIAAATITPTVWALAAGVLSTSISATVLSHLVVPGGRMGFWLDKPSAKEILVYGKWIFFSTATMFIASQGDKLILAKNISEKELGIYSIGAVFGLLLKEVASKFSHELLFPLYRKAVDQEITMISLLKTRCLVMVCSFFAAIFLSGMAEFIIQMLYDERYHGAGWILQFMAFAGLIHTFDDSIRIYLIANKDSFQSFCVQGLKAILFVLLSILLAPDYGVLGIIIAMTLSPLLVYPYLMYAVSKYGYRWQLLDLLAIVLMTLCFFLLWYGLGNELWIRLTSFTLLT